MIWVMSVSPLTGRRREDAADAAPAVEINFVAIFDAALLDVGLERKAAAALMAMDESQLSKALRGVPSHDIGLRKLMRLPPTFHAVFLLDLLKASFVAWGKRTWTQIHRTERVG